MIKIGLSVVLCLYSIWSAGGQTLFYDDFYEQDLSQWTPSGDFAENWSVTSSNSAGGLVPELVFTGTYPDANAKKTCRLISPVIDLEGYEEETIRLAFKHKITRRGAINVSVQTSTDDGETWNELWAVTDAVEGKELLSIPNPGQDVKGFRFCFQFTGNLMYIDKWAIDDVRLFFSIEEEHVMLKSVVPEKRPIMLPESSKLSFSFVNTGTKNIQSLEAWYQLDGKEPVSEIITGLMVAPEAIEEVSFKEELRNTEPGEHQIKVWVSKVNGTPVNSGMLTIGVEASHLTFINKKAMVELFTSSTCGGCPSANQALAVVLADNLGKWVVTKYQMDWPGDGDPYFSKEGGVRRFYYDIWAVPWLFIDGIQDQPLNSAYNRAKAVDVAGAFSVSGNSIAIDLHVIPYISGTHRIHVTVNEKLTTENVGDNGETEFDHVMMKMLPNAEGTIKEFVPGEMIRLSFNEDLSKTHIEEMDDLEVAIFIQNHETHEVLNAAYALQINASILPITNLTGTIQSEDVLLKWSKPNPATGFSGYNIYRNGTRLAENITSEEYLDEEVVAGTYIYSVAAVYSGNESSAIPAIVVVSPHIPAPQNIKAETEDHTSFAISWNAVEGNIKGYNIYRQGTRINNEPVQGTSFTDNVAYKGDYCYTVTTVTTTEESLHSEEACTLGYLPPTPRNIAAEQIQPGLLQVRISWDNTNSKTIDGYNIYRDNKKINHAPVTENEYTDVVSSFKEYCYTVTCLRDELESERSMPACVSLTDDVRIDDASEGTLLYPNPASSTVYLQGGRIACVHIYNMYGQLVREINNVSESDIVTINTATFHPGMYLFKITASGKTAFTKAVMIVR